MTEVKLERASSSRESRDRLSTRAAAKRISELDMSEEIRLSTGIGELDRVLGGGAVIGSLVLVGGAPGIGKSTLLLQMCGNLPGKSILYVTGEESERQLKLRAVRLGVEGDNILVPRRIWTPSSSASTPENLRSSSLIRSKRSRGTISIPRPAASVKCVSARCASCAWQKKKA